MPRYIARDSNTNPAANDIYVGQIPVDVDTQTLHALFSQFGEIERVFEGHRGTNNGMKWAFISFIHAQDAAK
jgi:RNA recognition motif-containing protein